MPKDFFDGEDALAIKVKSKWLCGELGHCSLGHVGYSAVTTNIGTDERVFGKYSIVYTIEGESIYYGADGAARQMRPGDLIIIFPDIRHSYLPAPGHSWTQFYTVFAGPVFDLWRQSGILDPERFMYRLRPIDFWLERFLSMVAQWKSAVAGSHGPVCAMQSMLSDIIERSEHAPQESDNGKWLEQACARIGAFRTTADADMNAVAAAMGLSYVAFRKKFTSLARVSPGKYHGQLVIRHACQLMYDEPISSKEIARRLGYCNEYYFSRRFKQLIGLTPSVFRRRLGRR